MRAIVFEAERDTYSVEQQAERTNMTVAELRRMLEDYDDDTLVLLSHDNGYTYGTVSEYDYSDWVETEDGWLRE